MTRMTLDGLAVEMKADERLIDLLLRTGSKIPHVCYHAQLGPIQTCDTCMVEVNGQLVRACATTVSAGMDVGRQVPKGRRRAAAGVRPDPRQPHALLHGLRQ